MNCVKFHSIYSPKQSASQKVKKRKKGTTQSCKSRAKSDQSTFLVLLYYIIFNKVHILERNCGGRKKEIHCILSIVKGSVYSLKFKSFLYSREKFHVYNRRYVLDILLVLLDKRKK